MRRNGKIRRGIKNNFTFIAAAALMVSAAVFPSFCAAALKDALSLCANTLIPSLFLYITAANLLAYCGVFGSFANTAAGRFLCRVTGLSPAGAAAFAVGMVSGFPSGVVFLSGMKREGSVTGVEAERLLPFVSNASPAFVVGAVGSLFGSPAFGAVLFAVQCAAALSGILLEKAFFSSAAGCFGAVRQEGFLSAFPRAVRESVLSMLAVCGYVAIFSVPCRLFANTGAAFLPSIFEIGNGCAAAGRERNMYAAAFAVGFSGLSVAFQTADIASRESIGMKYYLPGKLYIGIICTAAIYALSFFNLF